MVKSTDLGTVSIPCIIFIAKWDTQQAHACYKHGILSCDGMYTEAKKITCMCMMFTSHCVFKPDVLMFWNWPTLQSMCDRFWKQEYDWVSLGIPFTLQNEKNGCHIRVVFGDDVLALKTKSNNLHQLETCHTGLRSISIYCCTCEI